jgi:4-hydroxy-3-methylbut-2-enyl diphosphate reductase
MKVNIDSKSGFCFGVLNAISVAEKYLEKYETLFCLGDIVHNNKEIERLRKLGLIVIDHNDLENIYNTRVLIRAHGEPPSTYQEALKNKVEIIDASCPVVLKLQNRIRKSHQKMEATDGQLVIFGKEGHAEVVGLLGQTNNKAIVVGSDLKGLEKIDFTKPITLYSQTTQDRESYKELVEALRSKLKICQSVQQTEDSFQAFNTICGQVANRGPHLKKFAKINDVIVFVGGIKSSNGKYLYNICKQNNPNSYFVSDKNEIKREWFINANSAGICGATSTPMWLMKEVAKEINLLTKPT